MSSRQSSIFKPILLGIASVSLVGIGLVVFLLYTQLVAPLEAEFYERAVAETQLDIKQRLNAKIEETKSMAVAMTGYRGIREGIEQQDTAMVATHLLTLKKDFADISKYKTIWVRVLDADNKTLVRSWDKDKFGDTVKNSALLTQMLQAKETVGDISISEQGFVVLAIAPLKSGDKFLGSILLSAGVGAVVGEREVKY